MVFPMIGQVSIILVFDFENKNFHLAMLMVYILFENSVNLFIILIKQIKKRLIIYCHVDQKCNISEKCHKY
jgi:hypothetical protein